jgi:hypothetical protein
VNLRAGGPAFYAGALLGPGNSCFLAAADGAVSATGPATLFIAATGL